MLQKTLSILMQSNYKTLFRIIGSFLGWFAIILQLSINLYKAPSISVELVRYFSFMTIWTNIIIALSYTTPLLAPESRLAKFFEKPVIQGGLLIYILVVGLLYHFFLASMWNPQGWDRVADDLLHYAVPVFYLLYWILFAEKGKLRFINSMQWLIYPIIYVVYSLIRGALTDQYPYPFIDVSKMGYADALINTAYIFLGYIILGLIVVLFDRFLPTPLRSGTDR